ncbi:MAG: response regulator [Bacteroidota bacterium]
MKLQDLKIGTQLKIGFGIILVLIVMLGMLSFWQSDKLAEQTTELYNHPLMVRRALGELKADIINMHCMLKGMCLVENAKEAAMLIEEVDVNKASVEKQFGVLRDRYLGPPTDVDNAYNAFIKWNTIREQIIRMILDGNIKEAINNIKPEGAENQHVELLLKRLQTIDDFARNKGDQFYANAIRLKYTLNWQLAIMVVFILLITFFIILLLIKNIRQPITELVNATQNFQGGDMFARSSYHSKNEFGKLSASFNSMVENIQVNADLDNKTADIAAIMLSDYDAKKFFQATLNALITRTGSQMAAIYILDSTHNTFEHFESIGIDNQARQSFAADTNEGSFGMAIASKKIQHTKDIPDNTRFVFHTVTGKFIPHEIITIPILANNKVVAIISLACLNIYSKPSLQLVDNIFATLSARVEGIMAYHKNLEMLEKVEQQNHELEAQKTELASQSAELIEQNTELEMQKNQLKEANRLKTNFLSNMSHELRTPLNSVIALSGVLSRRLAKQIPEEEYSYLEVIERNGKNLLELINDILDISRIESGKEEIDISDFNINKIITEVITMLNPQAQQKKIKLLHSKDNVNLTINSDANKCRHILQNLISNAVKYTEIGKVEIITQLVETNIIITVTDTGIGIGEANIPHIFDEFRQADESTSRKYGGTGLGLAIAKKYAHMLGATIAVKSVVDKGSEFILTLPITYVAENAIIETQIYNLNKYPINQLSHTPPNPNFEHTILLVEDSEPAIIQIKDILVDKNYKILVAQDGANALEITSKTIPDAIILDLMMPGIDGFEILRILRESEQTSQIPVLILTAKHISKEELSFLKRNHIHQLIQKGDVNREALLKSISDMMAQQTPQTTTKPTLQNSTHNPTVLVVEDNADNMLTVKALLGNNFVVIEANNGKQCIEKAKTFKPDFILMDIALPEMDGIEAFQKIRTNALLKHIPIIALTASAMTTDRETILAYGFDAYIPKPIDQIIFYKTINETLYGK